LAKSIRRAVRPVINSLKGREVVGQAQSGDATFELDVIAEKALLTFLKRARRSVAYYSEDSGYTTFATGHPQNLLVIDPIDGTRAAKSGFEGCVISVCSTRVIERPTYADVDNALVMEIMGNRTFYAERGKGTKLYVDGHQRKITLSENTDLEQLTWSMTVPARPAELIFPVAARLMDLSSLKGGFFACNSTSYSLTRLVTNQLDACIDFANRFHRDIKDIVIDQFINAGRGNVVGVCPYDFAAGLLIAHEAGCIATDAYGKSLEDVLLLDSTVSNNRSIIAAANPALYSKLFGYFDTRIKQYEELYKRRAAASAN
jgi:myo-inositol-1(or 4)-monophosphatase